MTNVNSHAIFAENLSNLSFQSYNILMCMLSSRHPKVQALPLAPFCSANCLNEQYKHHLCMCVASSPDYREWYIVISKDDFFNPVSEIKRNQIAK